MKTKRRYIIMVILFALLLSPILGGSGQGNLWINQEIINADKNYSLSERKERQREIKNVSELYQREVKEEEKENLQKIQTQVEEITRSVKETRPKIAAGQWIYCKGIATNTIEVGVEFSKPVTSVDAYYYLVRINPLTDQIYGGVIAKEEKSESIKISLNVKDKPHLLLARYCFAVKTENGYERVSPVCYVQNPEITAENQALYEEAATKKGIQELPIKYLKETNSKQVFINLVVSNIFDTSEGKVVYEYDGKTYEFNPLKEDQKLVAECNKENIVVTAQILLNWIDKSLIIPEGREKGQLYYTWNTRETEGREKMNAIFSYLAEVFGQENCYITNWILGNEVNSNEAWNYSGTLPKSSYVPVYTEAFRSLHNAVRGKKASSKIFICLDHNWNKAESGYSARYFLDSFASAIQRMQPEVEWNVAYHAYPTPLTEVAFWENKNITNDVDSPIIHMKNLSVLTDYLASAYSSQIRVLLSEQGFTSTQGQKLQAAALAYAYYISAMNPMVEGFLIRSYKDNKIEKAQGLEMGIYNKKAYDVYKYMDTEEGIKYTNPYLKYTDLQSWNEIPGFSEEKASINYRMEE